MADYTPEEQSFIRRQRKDERDLPKYYLAETKTEVAITRDFESYLILQDPAQKQRILNWIRQAASLQKPKVDRDELLARYISNRLADADARLSELSSQTEQFEDLRSELIGDKNDQSRFASITEVGLLVQSLQKPLDEILLHKERAYHDKVLATAMRALLDVTAFSDETQKELKSWQLVVSAYPGRN